MAEGAGENPKIYKPPKIDRSAVGTIAVIVDGPDGKSGIAKLARSVRQLVTRCDLLRQEISKREREIDEMKQKYGVFGEVVGGAVGKVAGPIEAFFKGKIDELEDKKNELAAATQEIRDQSKQVYEEMGRIEETIGEYAGRDTAYQHAQALHDLLKKMKISTGLCRNATMSIERISQTGTQAEVSQAEQLRDRNVLVVNTALMEYWKLAKQSPRWVGSLPFTVDMSGIDAFWKSLDENQTLLREKMSAYILEIKKSLPREFHVYLSDEEQEYFKKLAQPSSDDNSEISKNNP